MILDSVDIICNNTDALIDYIVIILKKMIPISESSGQLDKKDKLPKLKHFINNFFEQCKSYVSTSVIIFALVYLKRIKDYIPSNSCGEFDTPYRLFIASILVSSKYLCEAGTNLTSKKLSKYTSFIFSCQEINQMERSFLGLIKYDLWVTKKTLGDFLKRYENQLQSQLINVFLYEDAFIPQNYHKQQQQQYHNNNHNNHRHYHHQHTSQKTILNNMVIQKKKYSFELTSPFLLSSSACSPSIRTFNFIKKSNKNKDVVY